eukprot:202690_1
MGNKQSRKNSKLNKAKKSKQDDEEMKSNDDEKRINRLTVYVIQGRNLPKYDMGPKAKSDPYVKVKFGDLKDQYRTRTFKRELNPVWNARFQEEEEGLFGKVNQIEFEVFDYDKISADDFMGRCSIQTNLSPRTHYSTPVQWINLVDEEG